MRREDRGQEEYRRVYVRHTLNDNKSAVAIPISFPRQGVGEIRTMNERPPKVQRKATFLSRVKSESKKWKGQFGQFSGSGASFSGLAPKKPSFEASDTRGTGRTESQTLFVGTRRRCKLYTWDASEKMMTTRVDEMRFRCQLFFLHHRECTHMYAYVRYIPLLTIHERARAQIHRYLYKFEITSRKQNRTAPIFLFFTSNPDEIFQINFTRQLFQRLSVYRPMYAYINHARNVYEQVYGGRVYIEDPRRPLKIVRHHIAPR